MKTPYNSHDLSAFNLYYANRELTQDLENNENAPWTIAEMIGFLAIEEAIYHADVYSENDIATFDKELEDYIFNDILFFLFKEASEKGEGLLKEHKEEGRTIYRDFLKKIKEDFDLNSELASEIYVLSANKVIIE